MAWLDYDGLLYFWQKIKAKLADKVDKVDGKRWHNYATCLF